MAAIQIDSVDATLVFPAADVEDTIALSLSEGAIIGQNYTIAPPIVETSSESSTPTSKESWS